MSAEDKSFIESLKDLVDNGVIGANISIDSGAEISGYGISRYSNDIDGSDNLTTSTPMLMSLGSLNDDGIIIDDEGNKWLIDNDGNRWLIDDKYPWYDCYKDEYSACVLPNSRYVSDRVLTLPLYADLNVSDVERICEVISGN